MIQRFSSLAALGVSFLTASVAHAKQPNVLFLAVDDMNDWIGCLNTTPSAITPNIDRLAARGVNFTNAHTPGVYCAPARAAIFSGQFASTTGCYQSADYFTDHPEIEGLQTSFSKAGFTTLGAGKLFHHREGSIDVRGWDHFFLRKESQRKEGWTLDNWSEETPFPDPFPASHFNKGKKVTGGLFLEWAGLPNESEEKMADTIRVNWAVDQLKKEHDKPFFLACGIYAPHFPNYCPQKYFDLYDRDAIELPPYKADDLDDLPAKIRKAKTGRSRIHKELEEKGAVKDAIHGYLACMSYADAMMGRVLDALDASPHADNTIVVLWSDHGYHHGEKYDWGKHTLWERTSNVPFIWAGPGVKKGAVTDVTASLIDMYPTFVEMCGLPKTHQKLDGTSLAQTLAKPEEAKDRDVYLPYMDPGEFAIINKDWRYISYGEHGEELYDLKADPNEWHNLAEKPEHAATKAMLRKSAPMEFAPANPKRNINKDLIIKGETFHWIKNPGKEAKPKAPAKKTAGKEKKKNVLFIVCDDLNTHVTPSGYEHILTPTMAQFASEAMTFKRAFCQYPVCGPSRASLLSGLYPESTGILDNKSDIRET
ncbi:sulfatase-like hydrolase/transferase, partial [Akkermansiaceae bacterium]|nr:sulfatase-like hydrolase/transferase [Akkermansiaceae bacterium]